MNIQEIVDKHTPEKTGVSYNSARADGVRIIIDMFESAYNDMVKNLFSRIGRSHNTHLLERLLPDLYKLEAGLREMDSQENTSTLKPIELNSSTVMSRRYVVEAIRKAGYEVKTLE